MSSNPGKKWPWIIIGSIFALLGFVFWTVSTAINNPVQLSDINMLGYHDVDRNANAMIKAKIAFNKKYTLEYVTEQFTPEAATVKFKINEVGGQAVNSADIVIKLTRPNTHDFDMEVPLKSVQNGIYTFETVSLPKAGRWDIISRIAIGDDVRYLNLKADTRYVNVFEF